MNAVSGDTGDNSAGGTGNSQRDEALEAVTGALVVAQDQLVAMSELSLLTVESFGRDDANDLLLHRARELTRSQSVSIRDAADGSSAPGSALPGLRVLNDGSMVISPVDDDGDRRGRELVFERDLAHPYSTTDLRVIDVIVGAVKTALALQELQREQLLRGAMQSEIDLASRLAQASLSSAMPELAGVEIFAVCTPARMAGGDFYTMVVEQDELWFAVGDVAGKGLPAAVIMSQVVSAARLSITNRQSDSVSDVLAAIDRQLYDYLDQIGLFITTLVGSFRPSNGTLRLANAGHSPVILSLSGDVSAVPPSTPPLGVVEGLRASEVTVTLKADDMIIIGSDGLTEQTAANGEMFGMNRFNDLILSSRRGAGELGRHVIDAVAAFGAGMPSSDDQTLVIVQSHAVGKTRPGRPTLVIAATPLALRELGSWLDELLSEIPQDEAMGLRSRLELAVHEVCMNVIDHAGLAENATVRIEGHRGPHSVEVTVADNGHPFDASGADAGLPEEPSEGGYGIAIARRLVDELRYERIADTNRLTLVVHRTLTQKEKTDD